MTRVSSPHVPARYLLFPLLAALIWSVNMIVTKMAASAIAPAAIGFYRWALAGVVLTPFALPGVWAQRRQILPSLPKLAVLGGLGMALYQGLAYVAAASTTATNMGIITAMIPLMTIAIVAVLLRELPSATAMLGGLLSLAGLALLIGEGDPARLLEVGANRGDLLMGVGALAYALYGVLLRRWALPVGPWQSLYVQVAFGVLFQLPAFLLAPPSPLNGDNLPLVLYAAVFPSLFAPFLWMQGVKHLGPNRASIFLNIMPVATVAIAAVFLDEKPHLFHIVGGAMALVGVMLAQMRSGARPARPKAA
ncbi:DMT family transporter [Achromobacter insolitus]|uniref:DMT family transporter n=1 Tax=Achromobacter insolitus TaxID=217204 RepID=UPI002659BE94|nr:DMT family transporter [Achromobacter insolitus]WKK16875.1 DMT family transporter [Achromobacter insolitus]